MGGTHCLPKGKLPCAGVNHDHYVVALKPTFFGQRVYNISRARLPPHQKKKIKASSLTEDMKYLVRVPECALFWPGRASHLFNLTLTPPLLPPSWQSALLQKLFKLFQYQRENAFEIKHPSNINFAI